ncbi:MAG TPA: hypothetical protein V6C76_16040 [Drouetiella sp.]
MGDNLEPLARTRDTEPSQSSRFCEESYSTPQAVRSDARSASDGTMGIPNLTIVDSDASSPRVALARGSGGRISNLLLEDDVPPPPEPGVRGRLNPGVDVPPPPEPGLSGRSNRDGDVPPPPEPGNPTEVRRSGDVPPPPEPGNPSEVRRSGDVPPPPKPGNPSEVRRSGDVPPPPEPVQRADVPSGPPDVSRSGERGVEGRVAGTNVFLDRDGYVNKIEYPAERKTREFGRDSNGEINKLVTTTDKGQYTYTKEGGDWIYNAPNGKKYKAPDMMLDDNGDFTKVVKDGVALTQRPDGSTYEESINAVGARVHLDENGRPDSVKRPDCSSVKASYNENGNLSQIVEHQDGKSITWNSDKKGNWISNEMPPQAVRDLKLETNGNLTYTSGETKYTVRSNGAELAERKGSEQCKFDEQGRMTSLKTAAGNGILTFSYSGSNEQPSSVQIKDQSRHTSKTYVHEPAKGGWTQYDENNKSIGVWKGDIRVQDDGTYSIKAKGDGWSDYHPNGKTEKESNPSPDLPSYPELPPERASTRRPESPATNNPDEQQPSDGSNRKPSPSTDDTVVKTDHSVHLTGYMLPSPNQLGAGSCLYMSATGIGEFLLNKSKGIAHPQVGGETDLSEQWTINLAKTRSLTNAYTDAPELLTAGGAKLDRDMPFKAYDSSSWMYERTIGGTGSVQIPKHQRDVLFSAGGESTQNASGVMRPEHLASIKNYLRDHESPVLFTWKAPGTNYWHADIITGYDDKTQQFTVRDSSFGQDQTNLPSYNYGGTSRYGAKPYKNEWHLSYTQALQWGNHATGYRLSDG